MAGGIPMFPTAQIGESNNNNNKKFQKKKEKKKKSIYYNVYKTPTIRPERQ